jgi:RNA recognition motif-containing protein
VGNLRFEANKRDLRDHFDRIGRLEDVYVPNAKGYGFVTFESLKDAENAVEELHRSELSGRKIVVEFAKPRR